MSHHPNSTALQETLPTAEYLSEEVFDREKERIFFNEWLCAVR